MLFGRLWDFELEKWLNSLKWDLKVQKSRTTEDGRDEDNMGYRSSAQEASERKNIIWTTVNSSNILAKNCRTFSPVQKQSAGGKIEEFGTNVAGAGDISR